MSVQATTPEGRPKRHRRQKYSAEPLATMPDEESLGPALRACTDMQRKFVLELAIGPAGYGNLIRAAKAAGYGSTSTIQAMTVITANLMHSERVQAAPRETGYKQITAQSIQSIENVTRIANDLEHRDCLKANLALLERGGFGAAYTVNVEKNVTETIVVVDDRVLQRIRDLCAKAGVDAQRQIELTATEVK